MLKSDILLRKEEFEHSEFYLKSHNNTVLFTQSWVPHNQSKAVVILIHSLGEHSTRFKQWAELLVSHKFSVLAFDLRGHGHSEMAKKWAFSYTDFLQDIEVVIKKATELHPHVPVFLYGHGFGGTLALNYVISKFPVVKGLVLSSPWLDPIKKINPYLSKFLKPLMSLAPGVSIKTGLRPEDISRDVRIVHTFSNDPLIRKKVSIHLIYQINDAAFIASKSIYKINVPMLLMHGTEDQIASCQTSRNFILNASKRNTYVEWVGATHELHSDLDKIKIFDTLVKWFNEYC